MQKKSLIGNSLIEPEFSLLAKNPKTGVTTSRLGNFEANHKLHGVGFEISKEKLPDGKVNEITKKSLTIYGVTFERVNNSDGSWSNEFRLSASWLRSLGIGVKGEVALSILKESYKPNK